MVNLECKPFRYEWHLDHGYEMQKYCLMRHGEFWANKVDDNFCIPKFTITGKRKEVCLRTAKKIKRNARVRADNDKDATRKCKKLRSQVVLRESRMDRRQPFMDGNYDMWVR